MQIEKPLLNRVAMISGALGSIGQAIAIELARRGAHVSLADIHDGDAAGALLKHQVFGSGEHMYRKVDVSNAEEVSAWMSETEQKLGVPSIAIPCAAVVTRLGVREVDAASWSREMRINLDGSFNLAQQAALGMARSSTPGNIVFIGSWVAERPVPRIVTYCAGKAAQRMLMKCMALEFAGEGIVVNEVAPGYVNAGLTGETLKAYPERRNLLEQQTPTGKLIEAAEVAFHVANMCDSRWSGVTGTTFLLDGGVSLRTGS